ncbi:apyrase 2 [Euphorbia peplus]|nr:apyrase 2 [Euphorbia peplus]
MEQWRWDGQMNLFVASFFFDRAAEAVFIGPALFVAKVHTTDSEETTRRARETKLENAKSTYPVFVERFHDERKLLALDFDLNKGLAVWGSWSW